MSGITLSNSRKVMATSTPQKILSRTQGFRGSLMIQAKGDDPIAIFFSQSDVDNGIEWILQPFEWPVWNSEDMIRNDIFIMSKGAEQEVVFQCNESKF